MDHVDVLVTSFLDFDNGLLGLSDLEIKLTAEVLSIRDAYSS
jgi:hypothetical protein